MSPQEFETALSLLFDGELDPATFARLEEFLMSSAEARQCYLEYVDLHNVLDLKLAPAPPMVRQVGRPAVLPIHLRFRKKKRKTLPLAVAAMVTLAAVIAGLLYAGPKRPAMVFRCAEGTTYTLTHLDAARPPTGMALEPGSRLVLTQGVVQLEFRNQVRAVVQAPADLTLRAGNSLDLTEGTGWFHVPKNARGFRVDTPELGVVDLGTTFGVRSDAGLGDEVHVFEGQVIGTGLTGAKESETLVAPQARSLDLGGHLQRITPSEGLFLSELPAALPHLHWSFDEPQPLAPSSTLAGKPVGGRLLGSALTKRPQLQAGKFGKAIDLQPPGESIQSDWPGFTGNQPRSVAFWLKMPQRRLTDDGINGNILVGWGKQHGGDEIHLNHKWTVHLDYRYDRHPVLNVSFGGFWYFFPEVVLDDDQWHHLAVVYEGKSDSRGFPTTRVYLDGSKVRGRFDHHSRLNLDRDGSVVVDTQASVPLMIGGGLSSKSASGIDSNAHFIGRIDELYVIRGAIDEEAVLRLMRENRLGQ